MNWLKQIQISAFQDELSKIANIEIDKNGRVVYHSNDEITEEEKKKQDPKNNYELYTEDSASGNSTIQTEPTPN
jgi:hypothetical protein